VPTPEGGSYCIDATEVTNGQYAEFLDADPLLSHPPASLPEGCGFKTSYEPDGGLAAGRSTYPVTYVDWCDAFAYCAWAGKRLCGAINGDANPCDALEDATTSLWYNACSKGGTQAYPYGESYSATTCNGQDYGAATLLPAGATDDCEATRASLT
jgi:sulfatase modifying factor 1